MIIRQSDLKTWAKCPLIWKYERIDGLARHQSGALTFGSIVHVCIEYLEIHRDLPGAIAKFHQLWDEPTLLGPEYKITYYVRGTNWKKYRDLGETILRNQDRILAWSSSVVLAREYTFDVPIGDGHTLHGTVDKLELRYDASLGAWVLVIVDYKTNNKRPTGDYLSEDIQFSAYAFASTRPEFWTGIQDGARLFEEHKDTPRYGEWIALTQPLRLDAGVRLQRHYERLTIAVNHMAASIKAGIFVPNISGDTCRWCDYREKCGIPPLDAEGNPPEELP